MSLKKKLFILFIFILLIGILYIYNNNKNNKKIYFPIVKININSSEIRNSNEEKIREYSEKYLINKSWFNFNINILKNELEKIEWVNTVGVRRVYPREVKLTIKEHVPLVIWNNKYYMNGDGEVFFVKNISKKLPRLNAKNDRSKTLFKYYSFFINNLLKNNISDKILEINENDIRSLSILLSSGISVRFGSKNVNEKIKIFFKSYNKILNTSDLKKIRYIDMRYSNGFSIGWK